MASSIRWALAVAGAIGILLGMFWMFAPEMEVLGVPPTGFMGTPVIPTEDVNYYGFAVGWIGLVLLMQWFFLRPRGGWSIREATRGRPMGLASIGAGFCGMLLTFGLVAALMEIPDLWKDVATRDDFIRPGVYFWLIALWIVWALVFYRYGRGKSRILRALISGTIVELLVAAPVHAACYKRDDCYCARGSYTALVFGGTALFWVFGPGILLLYQRERERRGRLLRRCPDCGHDLSGSAATICPECGYEMADLAIDEQR